MRASTLLWAVHKAAAPVKKVVPVAARRSTLPKPIAQSLQASAKANSKVQPTYDWPVVGKGSKVKAGAGEYVVDERQKGLLASYMGECAAKSR